MFFLYKRLNHLPSTNQPQKYNLQFLCTEYLLSANLENVPSSTWIPFLLSYVGCMSWKTFIAQELPQFKYWRQDTSGPLAVHTNIGGHIIPTPPKRVHFCGKRQPLITPLPSPPSSSSYIATIEILLDCTFFKLSPCGMFIEKIYIEYKKLILLWVTEYNIQYFRLCFDQHISRCT